MRYNFAQALNQIKITTKTKHPIHYSRHVFLKHYHIVDKEEMRESINMFLYLKYNLYVQYVFSNDSKNLTNT